MSKPHHKIAIIHDTLLYAGGAERVFVELLAMFPKADIYTSLANETYIASLPLKGKKVHASFLSRLPWVEVFASLLKPFIYVYWKRIDLQRYDIVISSSHSFSSKSVITNPAAIHISYIHSPPRYLYDEYNEMQWTKSMMGRIVLYPLFQLLRKIDLSDAQKPTVLIANSKTVQARVLRYYRRESVVLYPPVRALRQHAHHTKEKQYYMCVSRLVKQKGVDLIIKACNNLRLPLVVVGTGPQERALRSLAGPTVRLLGWVPDHELADIYSHAKALCYASIDEDFGIAPVEAQAVGVPVLGSSTGGIAETVIPGKTGLLFTDRTVPGITAAFRVFEKRSFSRDTCRRNAQRYSVSAFHSGFLNILHQYTRHE